MKTMIIGACGQDGQLLAKHLRSRGHTVIGIGRRPIGRDVSRNWIDSYHCIDVAAQPFEYASLLEAVHPAAIFYTAAIHGPSGTELESRWRELQGTTILGLHQTLEFARVNRSTRVINFSSSRVFGRSFQGNISENTPRKPVDIYGLAKTNADSLVEFYRQYHDVLATSLIFFNHESNLRGSNYFSTKVIQNLKAIHAGGRPQADLATLDFWADWGLADEYMKIVATVFEGFRRPNYIFATGKTCYGYGLIIELCHHLGIDERLMMKAHLADRGNPTTSPSPPWTAEPKALADDTQVFPRVTGKDVFLSLLAETT